MSEEDLLTGAEVARRLGIRPHTWFEYRSAGTTPEPDVVDGKGRGRWLPETIDAWQRGRPGSGNRSPRLYSREALARLRAGGAL